MEHQVECPLCEERVEGKHINKTTGEVHNAYQSGLFWVVETEEGK